MKNHLINLLKFQNKMTLVKILKTKYEMKMMDYISKIR